MDDFFNIGRMTDLVIVQRNEPTSDPAYGTSVDNWLSIVNQAGSPTLPLKLFAEFVDELGSEGVVTPSASRSSTGLMLARGQTLVKMRYRSDLTGAMRLLRCAREPGGDDVPYTIVKGPAEVGRKYGLQFVCERFSS